MSYQGISFASYLTTIPFTLDVPFIVMHHCVMKLLNYGKYSVYGHYNIELVYYVEGWKMCVCNAPVVSYAVKFLRCLNFITLICVKFLRCVWISAQNAFVVSAVLCEKIDHHLHYSDSYFKKCRFIHGCEICYAWFFLKPELSFLFKLTFPTTQHNVLLI